MAFRCPGQLRRDITASCHPCPRCGEPVEIFSDEVSAACPGCGARACKERVPTCVEWCRSARQCIGAERYDRIMAETKAVTGSRLLGSVFGPRFAATRAESAFWIALSRPRSPPISPLPVPAESLRAARDVTTRT